MNSKTIRQKYLEFFKREPRSHQEIPAAPLVSTHDPTTLFTSAGMQPLAPYLKGEKEHPLGKRLVNSQPSLRTQDIMEVGDTSHTTFFEMLGNWSLGDYFKKEQLPWCWEFLTEELKLPQEKLYVTVFEGDSFVPKDKESAEIWQGLNIPEKRIFYYGVDKNWWSMSGSPDKMSPGEIGGPDSEVFYDFGTPHNPKYGQECHPNCECGRFLEIGNSVFIQYVKNPDGTISELPQKNVDFGGGLERLVAAVNNQPDIFKIDLFRPIIKAVEKASSKSYEENQSQLLMRIAADHLKAATFLMVAGIKPSNKLHGYVLRRLLRRAAIKIHTLEKRANEHDFVTICESVLDLYDGIYLDKEQKKELIAEEVRAEIFRFTQTLDRGMREIQKINRVDGKIAFDFYQSYGFPLEITEELVREKGQEIDHKQFEEEFEKHRELSRTTSAGMFKGGLAEDTPQTRKLHTTTHLLHAALRQILGTHVKQTGSNITAQRLRFDFTHPQKLTEEEIKKVEELVNQKIQADLPVTVTEMTQNEALQSGALAFFGEKYGDRVKVYTIGDPSARSGPPFSREICGGPHVKSTKEVGLFEITKEEQIGAGIGRIYATVS